MASSRTWTSSTQPSSRRYRRSRQREPPTMSAGSHDHDAEPWGPIEDNPIWQQDNVTLNSVGIDIGSAGTQVLFSRLHLRRISEDLSSRYIVVRRDTVFQSPVVLTPYEDEERIDATALGAIIDRAYRAAHTDPAAVDTGVVILTGEAVRRRNAARIAALLAERGGELVTASAGHHMEAMLAAYGSGAARRSYEQGLRILNVDIGGGTTKVGVVDNGRVTATAAIHIGGRLQVVDADGRIVRLEPAGARHARRAGFAWSLGDLVDGQDLNRVADGMADALVTMIMDRRPGEELAALALTEPIPDLGEIDGVMFSGGVAEYVYGRERRDFGDLGRLLGEAIRMRLASGALPLTLLDAGECIRATALGASEYSVRLSGNTGWISDPDALLPRRNLQVLRPDYALAETVDPVTVADAIRAHLVAFDVEGAAEDVALSLTWDGPPAYDRVAAFARGIAAGLADRIERRQPLYLLLDGDVALTVGTILTEELAVKSELLVIDGLSLWDFDYIDIGRVRLPSNTVPVTVKSLVFNEDPHVRRPAGSP
ncbi:MAG: recombinase [Propionibacteriales bacterium]|nr:recombinase [Propionibacteriales bacterium]